MPYRPCRFTSVATRHIYVRTARHVCRVYLVLNPILARDLSQSDRKNHQGTFPMTYQSRRMQQNKSRPPIALNAIAHSVIGDHPTANLSSAILTIAQLDAEYEATSDRRPLAPANLTNLGLSYWQAYAALASGRSSGDHWGIVSSSLNTALILAEKGIGAEYAPYINKALDCSWRVFMRAKRTGLWRFDGEGMSAVREALEIHDEQIKLATKEDFRNAFAEVKRRAESGDIYAEQIA